MDEHSIAAVRFFSFILRIVIMAFCINKSGKLNRSKWGWGIFGFFMPLVAIIWIQFMKPIIMWERNTSQNENEKVTPNNL